MNIRLRHTSHIGLLMLVSLVVLFLAAPTKPKFYKDVKHPKINEFQVPKVERVKLGNGIELFLLEDHELPLINLSVRIGAGEIYDPDDKRGLASLTGEVMRTGGSTSMSGEAMDELLESLAASLETQIDLTTGTASLSVLKEDMDQGLKILVDLLMNPAFPQDKLDLAKTQERSNISRRNDSPDELTRREYKKLIYGADSPYARQTEYATIDAITREDLVAFHQRFFHPQNMMIGVWGDFNLTELQSKIESAFSAWKPSVAFERPKLPEVKYEFNSAAYLIKKSDLDQTHILMGHIGGLRNDSDYFALIMMNDILGGSFSSRLFRNVRDKQGLAYSVFGFYQANYDYPGIFYVGCQTKTETTMQAIRAMRTEIERLAKEPVTDEELATAKDSFLNSFVFNFDTKGEIVNRLMTYVYYGYPVDFLEKTKENVEKITKEDILRVAQKFLHSDQLRILAVGNADRFDEPLNSLGSSVTEIDISIPVPQEVLPQATEESKAAGQTLLNRAILAIGGAEPLKKLENVKMTADLQMNMGGQSIEVPIVDLFVYPDRQRQEMMFPFGKILIVRTGDQGWNQTPQGISDLDPGQITEMKESLIKENLSLLKFAQERNYEVQSLTNPNDASPSDILMISQKDQFSVKLFLNKETAQIEKKQTQGSVMGRMAKIEETYADYQNISGLKLPFSIQTTADGQPFSKLTVKQYDINAPVEQTLFEQP